MADYFRTLKKLAEIVLRMGEAWVDGALGLLRPGGLRNNIRFFFGGFGGKDKQ